MRILSVTAQKPHSTGSGVYLTGLVNSFSQMGHEQAVIAGVYREDEVCFPREVEFCPVYFRTEELPFAITGMSDEMPYESTRYRDMTPEMTEQFFQAFGKRVTETVERFQPDIILCHHLYLLTALVRKLCPDCRVEGICHGSDLRQIKQNGLFREEIIREIQKLDGIWALHREQKEQIEEIFSCREGQVQVLGTGYDGRIFSCTKERTEREAGRRKGRKDLRLAFAGKISEKKGVKSLLRAMDYLDWPEGEVSLTLAGGWGQEEEHREIERLAGACRYPVEFAGRLAQPELAALLNTRDVFVLPSFYEGLPLSVIEALACGCRVVCTDLPGIRPWLEENVPGHGVEFVLPPRMRNEDEPEGEDLPGFERALADAIVRAAEKTGNREKLARSLEKVSWDGIAGKVLKGRAEQLTTAVRP